MNKFIITAIVSFELMFMGCKEILRFDTISNYIGV